MSLKRLAVISAVGSHNSFNNQTISYVSSYSGASGGSVVEQGAVGSAGSASNNGRTTGGHHQGLLHTMRPGANLHGNVNIMLGGAMLSVVVTVVCFVCYCCHRNIKKRSNSLYRQQWLETEANMEIYSVEQCYDPPAPSGGGFLMDSASVDYQSLPVVSSGSINHGSAHQPPPFGYHTPYHQHHPPLHQLHQHQHHHHQHQLHYPNGPPPSYDTVVAQDELLGGESRRKRLDEERPTQRCPFEGRQGGAGGCKSSGAGCAEAWLRKVSSSGGVRSQAARGRHGFADRDEPDVTEPFWRSIELEEAERAEERERDAPGGPPRPPPPAGCCGCSSGLEIELAGSRGSLQVPPTYCRNCGYHVPPECGVGEWQALATDARTDPSSHASGRSGWPRLDAMNNEPLLVDYDDTSGPSTSTSRPALAAEGASNNHGHNHVDSDKLPVPPTTVTTMMMATSPSLDGANNNTDPPDQQAPLACPVADASPNEALFRDTLRSNEGNNNNVVIIRPSSTAEEHGATTTTTTTTARAVEQREAPVGGVDLIEILTDPHPPEVVVPQEEEGNGEEGARGSISSRRMAAEDLTNGNGNDGAGPQLDAATNGGLVRLDMSQIIDHTGLPTYEAALKLESSGYV